MEQNLPQDYTSLQASVAVRATNRDVWNQINWLWCELDRRQLAMLDVGGATVKESLHNCFKAIDFSAPWPTGGEIMSIHNVIDAFAKALDIQVEVYYLTHNEQGNNHLGCHVVGERGGLIYRICVLPTLISRLVVGGNSKELLMRERRRERLAKLKELISQLKANSDDISKRLVEDYEKFYHKQVLELLAEQRKPLVGVIGGAGVGKTTLLNAIIGQRLLPSRGGVQSVTAFPTVLSYADIDGYDMCFEFISLADVLSTLSHLAESITDEDDKSSQKDPRTVFMNLINGGVQAKITPAQKIKLLVDALKKKDLTGLDVAPELLAILKMILADETELVHIEKVLDVKNWFNALSDLKNALIKKVTIKGRMDVLKQVDLVDLPGLGDVIEYRSQLTYHFIKKECQFLFYVRKERFVDSEVELYNRLLDLQAQFAIIYTNFFSINESSVENLLSFYQDWSHNDSRNFTSCLIAKHFKETRDFRSVGASVEESKKEKGQNNDLPIHTSSVPIITVDSQWKNVKGSVKVEYEDEELSVPICLSNVTTVQYYVQYIANKFIKAHSEEMAEVMERWFQSIRAARKKPVLEEEILLSLINKVIKVDHSFPLNVMEVGPLQQYFDDCVKKNLYATQTAVLGCFRNYNGYVRGRAWSRIVANAIDKMASYPDINAELYRPVLRAFTQDCSPLLLNCVSDLVHEVLAYIDSALANLNKLIAQETSKVEQVPILEARLPMTLAKRVHDLPMFAKKYVASLVDKLLDVVYDKASPRYDLAFQDYGSGVVARVSSLLSEANFVMEVLHAQTDYILATFVPEFYNILNQEAGDIVTSVLEDTKRTFTPLTIGTPVTLNELMQHPHFKAIVDLLTGIAEDAKSLN